MTSLLIYTLAVFGLCFIIGHSTVTLGFRQYLADYAIDERISIVCPLCGEESYDDAEWTPGADSLTIVCPACHQGTTTNYFVGTQEGRERFIRHAKQPFRLVVELLECPACLSVWLGLAYGAYVSWGAPWSDVAANAAMTAAYSAGSSYLLARITNLIPPPPEDDK